MDARLDSAFESWGKFCLPRKDSPNIPGRLFYHPREGLRLELVEAPTGANLQAIMAMPSLPTLYGRLVDGTLVTLVDSFATKVQMGAGGLGLPTALTANRVLVGAHIDDLDRLQVRTYTIELSSLANWAWASPLKLERPTVDGKNIGVDLSFRLPEPIVVDPPNSEFALRISQGARESCDLGSYTIRWHAGVTIASHHGMVVADINKVAWQCENLMSLLIGGRVSVRSIAIKPAQPPSPASAEQSLHLIYQQQGKHDHPDLHPLQMLLPYSLVKQEFPQIVAQWFARSEQAVLASNVFFGSQRLESPTLDVAFLAATQAAESYHRSLGTGVYMKQDEYDTAIAHFCSAIPPAIQGDHRESLKSRLKWGNECSLRKRLSELLHRISSGVRAKISPDASKFVGRVVDTRNYFTHWDHASQKNSFEGKDLFIVSERLRMLVVANLLHDLGISDEGLLSILQRNREFQHCMSQDLAL